MNETNTTTTPNHFSRDLGYYSITLPESITDTIQAMPTDKLKGLFADVANKIESSAYLRSRHLTNSQDDLSVYLRSRHLTNSQDDLIEVELSHPNPNAWLSFAQWLLDGIKERSIGE